MNNLKSKEIEAERIGITVDEARKMLGIGKNLMLELVKLKGFPAIRFKRKIIIDKEKLPIWFSKNYGQEFGKYDYCKRAEKHEA